MSPEQQGFISSEVSTMRPLEVRVEALLLEAGAQVVSKQRAGGDWVLSRQARVTCPDQNNNNTQGSIEIHQEPRADARRYFAVSCDSGYFEWREGVEPAAIAAELKLIRDFLELSRVYSGVKAPILQVEAHEASIPAVQPGREIGVARRILQLLCGRRKGWNARNTL